LELVARSATTMYRQDVDGDSGVKRVRLWPSAR
jgi:hypothetical protein